MKQDNHIDFTLLLKVQWKELYNVNNIFISIHKIIFAIPVLTSAPGCVYFFIHVAAISSKIRIMHFIQYSYRFLNVSKSRYWHYKVIIV